MSNDLSQQQVVSQSQILSQQLQLSAKILQMDSVELLKYVEQVVETNPVIDIDIYSVDMEKRRAFYEQVSPLFRTLTSTQRDDHATAFDIALQTTPASAQKSFRSYLREQLLALPEHQSSLKPVVTFLIEDLDSDGYLNDTDEFLATQLRIKMSVLRDALLLLRSLDPPGVGARSLSDCLNLQLDRLAPTETCLLAKSIVLEHIGLLSGNQLHQIAHKLRVGIHQVAEAQALIRSLNPRPSNGFGNDGESISIVPDLYIVRDKDGEFEVIFNDDLTPTIRISSEYQQLRKGANSDVRKYINQHIKNARQLMLFLNKRKATMLACTQAILMRQYEFFRLGPRALVPLTMEEIAEPLDVNVSTISRTVRNKYLLCEWGVFPLQYFFTHAVGQMQHTRNDVYHALQFLIDAEDKHAPLSDDAIAKKLCAQNMQVSRRTVTKYRIAMNIPAALGRKIYDTDS